MPSAQVASQDAQTQVIYAQREREKWSEEKDNQNGQSQEKLNIKEEAKKVKDRVNDRNKKAKKAGH